MILQILHLLLLIGDQLFFHEVNLDELLLFILIFLFFHFLLINITLSLLKDALFDLVILLIQLNELLLNETSFKVQLFYLLFDDLGHQVNFLGSHWSLRLVATVLDLRSCQCHICSSSLLSQ